jgi:hypothetical protein
VAERLDGLGRVDLEVECDPLALVLGAWRSMTTPSLNTTWPFGNSSRHGTCARAQGDADVYLGVLCVVARPVGKRARRPVRDPFPTVEVTISDLDETLPVGSPPEW